MSGIFRVINFFIDKSFRFLGASFTKKIGFLLNVCYNNNRKERCVFVEGQHTNKKSIILAIVALIFVCGLSFFISMTKTSDDDSSGGEDVAAIIERAQRESKAISLEEQKDLESIDVDKYLEIYAGDNNQLVLLATSSCSYCQIAEPIIKHLAYQYNIPIYYLDPNQFTDDDESRFVQSNEMFHEGFGTPLLLLVSSSKIVDKIDGLTDTKHYKKFFETYDFIHE